jgi:hypothetical protein
MTNAYNILLENLKGRHLEENLGIDRRALNGSYRSSGESVKWIRLVQDKDQSSAVMTAVMNFRVA